MATRYPQVDFHGMKAKSLVMKRVFKAIRLAGPSDFPVLIIGKTGTGKELAARAVHDESRRKKGPFVPVNCGALPDGVLESELFGHVPGAFTGAVRYRKGRFELADGGTLFLDEVADLSPAAQVKLLRVLEDNCITPVGGERSVPVDVRIVSATNKDLAEEVRNGNFREDLFYRLSVVPIALPPLAERPGDIEPIAQSVVKAIHERTGKPICTVDEKAVALLESHSWQGNVRHLISVLQYASILCNGEVLLPEHLPKWDSWTLPPCPAKRKSPSKDKNVDEHRSGRVGIFCRP